MQRHACAGMRSVAGPGATAGDFERVAEYRAYAIGSDGHIVHWKPLICDSDNEAIDKAREAFEGHAVEVWSRDRLIIRPDCAPLNRRE